VAGARARAWCLGRRTGVEWGAEGGSGVARAGSRRRGLYPVVVYKMVQIARGVVKWLRSRAVSAC
jgi:hypothetical protein